LLINLAGHAPLLPGADKLAYIDIDDTVRQTYGYAKQGAGRGYTGTKGLNALLVIVAGAGDRRRPPAQALHEQREGRPPARR
jgi:hypothetical protein